MSPQSLAALALVAGAALYLARAAWRATGGGCAAGCGRCAAPEPADTRRIALNQVKG